PGAQRAGRPGGRPGGWPGGAMAAEHGGPPGPGGARGPGRSTTVFVPDEKGQPKPVDVRIGISDGQFVELRQGLDERAVVITGTEIPGARAAGGPRPSGSPSSNPFQPQRPQPRQR
ncbi:MAG TPA: hypothetical protein VLL75_07615, partial [Vicinamibacteria bacterium]|nr:hypothetical protein [Vicinamibacteria bacterium]